MSSTIDAVATDLESILFREHAERSYEVDNVEGDIPAYVRGTWYVNGPAKFERNGQRYQNWLDGDGMLCALRFNSDAIKFTSRYVQTKKITDEDAAGRFLYRTFGTAFDGDRLKRGLGTESPANVTVETFDGRLLAFGEQSIPLEIDAYSLRTIGPFDFKGQLNSVSPFSAHPKIDPENGELLNFGIAFSAQQPLLHFYRFHDDGQLLCRSRTALDHPCSLHDFAVSRNFASFYLSPYVMNMEALRSGFSTIDSQEWRQSASQLLILHRESGDLAARIEIANGYSLHTINSFERDDLLFLDVIEIARPVYGDYQPLPYLFQSPPQGRPVRIVVDVANSRVVDRIETVYDGLPDFPCLHPASATKDYDQFWMLGIPSGPPGETKFFTQLLGWRWSNPEVVEMYSCEAGTYLSGEPVCVCNPDAPHEHTVLCQEYDALNDSSSVLFFDGQCVDNGPIARLRLQAPVHFGFHATFVNADLDDRMSGCVAW